MTSAPTQIPDADRTAASPRHSLAALLIVALPLATIVMTRVATVVLIAAPLFALLTRRVELRALCADAWAIARQPLAATALALSAWSGVSAIWALDPQAAAIYALRAILTLVIVIFAAAATTHETEDRERFAKLAFYALCATALAVIIAARFHDEVGSALGRSMEGFRANRGAVTICLLLPAACLLNWNRFERVAILYGLCAAAIMLSSSESAKLALATGTIMFVLTRWGRRLAMALFGFGALAVTVFLPLTLAVVRQISQSPLMQLFSGGHPEARLEIWRQFLLLTSEKPFFGWGLESSRFLFRDEVWRLAPRLQILDQSSMHPHNMFLQMWFEIGVVGSVLALALLAAGLMCVRHVTPRQQAFALALAAMQATVAFVSHGAWQNWWIALVGMSIIILARAGHAIGPDSARA